MNQNTDNPTADAVDCSEAMEAKIADKARELIKLCKVVGKSVSGFVHTDRLGLVRIRIDAMADDADESSVQKTHPSNQISPILSKAMDDLEEFWRKNDIDPLDCDGRAEGHNTAQAPDGR